MSERTAAPAGEDIGLGEELTPWQRVRRNLAADRMAMGGGVVLVLFFALALLGWLTTSGEKPHFDPRVVR
ncbi:MAG: hypothetical protein AABZ64_09005, partial [Nitrospinota bacterium]